MSSPIDDSVKDKDEHMSHVRCIATPKLTVEERRLIMALRKADDPVRTIINNMLGIPSLPGLSEGERSSEDTETVAHGKQKVPLESESMTKDPRSEAITKSSVDLSKLSNPRRAFHCFMQVDNGPVIGDIAPVGKGICPMLVLDSGRVGSPTIGLNFQYPGSTDRSVEVGSIKWSADDHIQGHWVVRRFDAVRIPATDSSQTRSTIENLFYITLDLRACVSGYSKIEKAVYNSWRTTKGHAASLRTLFGAREDYQVQIWVLGDAQESDFQETCLDSFKGLFEQRQLQLGQAQDMHGVYLMDLKEASLPRSMVNIPTKASLPRPTGQEQSGKAGKEPSRRSPSRPSSSTSHKQGLGPAGMVGSESYANKAIPSTDLNLPMPLITSNTDTSNLLHSPRGPVKTDPTFAAAGTGQPLLADQNQVASSEVSKSPKPPPAVMANPASLRPPPPPSSVPVQIGEGSGHLDSFAQKMMAKLEVSDDDDDEDDDEE